MKTKNNNIQRLVITCISLLLAAGACAPPGNLSPIISPPSATNPPPILSTEDTMATSRPLVIAHRGARSIAPENTLSAARKAFELGADMWELDVAVSADGELFLMHDDTLERTCNVRELFPDRKPWNCESFTLAEIRQLDCGSWFIDKDPFDQIKKGVVSGEDQAAYVGEKAPTLREALEYTRANQWKVNVEIKSQPSPAAAKIAVEKTVALVEELGMDDGEQVFISSFDHAYLQSVHELNSRIPIQLLTSTPIDNLEAYAANFDTQMVNPKNNAWDPQELKILTEAGFQFNVWTVNEEKDMLELIDAKVHGIITDYPQLLIPYLR